jgi:pheophorbide a oxygenase
MQHGHQRKMIKPVNTSSPLSTSPQLFNWSKQWYPVMVASDADEDIPHARQILGLDLVFWRDKNLGKWVAFEDRCPHRLAQLSEGRIDKETGTLQCNYHGWTFSGSGSCKSIPQIAGLENASSLMSNQRACATVYPTVEREGLIWVWADHKSEPEAISAPWKGLAPSIDQIGTKAFMGNHGWYYREIPSGYIANKENAFNDPSHDTILHHKASPAFDRKRATPFPESTVSEITIDGYSTTHSLFTKLGTRSFKDTVVPPTGNLRSSASSSPMAFEGVAYSTPAAMGKTHFFATFIKPSGFAGFSPLSIIFACKWIAHLMTCDLTDADNVIQYGVDLNRAKGKGRQVYLPSDADRGVAAFWTWLERFAGGGPPVSTLSSPIDPNVPVPRRILLDRYHQHTIHCKSCTGAMKGFERACALFGLIACGLFVASISSLTFGISSAVGLKATLASASPLILAALSLVSALIASFCSSMVQKFVFVDYDKDHVSKR